MRVRGFATVALACCTPVAAGASGLVSPIAGVAYQDWTIVNYVDLDPGPGILDWSGGSYSYDGHDAIDFTLPNFAAMDAGVDVVAARGGTVVEVHDGEYDRWSRANPNPGAAANYVIIDHGGGLVTQYRHLKKLSIPVSVGQVVSAGQKIGEVGSSGYSTDAHLHFTVVQDGNTVETYQDPSFWWLSPLAYAGDVSGTLDFGVTDHAPTTEELVERPVDADLFLQTNGSGQEAFTWVNLFGFDAGDQLDFFFYAPDGTEYAHWSWTTDEMRYDWWVAGIGLPDVPDLGEWTISALRNGAPLYSDSFFVAVPEPRALSLLVAAAGLAAGARRGRARAAGARTR